jgi:very-short-patch-repair endonuclease
MTVAEDQCAYLLKAIKISGWEREFRFAPPRRWRFDFAWPEQKIALEIEGGTWVGGRHNRGAGYAKDLEKYNTATVLGWRLLRVTPEMVSDGTVLSLIEALLDSIPPQVVA